MADMNTRFRIGLVQMRAGKDIQENLARAEAFIRDAARRGAQYIQTPENTAIMETDAPGSSKKSHRKIKPRGSHSSLTWQGNWAFGCTSARSP